MKRIEIVNEIAKERMVETMGTILEVLIDSFEDSCKEDDL